MPARPPRLSAVTDSASQVERADAGIRSRAIDGSYPPGTQFSEPTFSRFHATSRTPVREALAPPAEEAYVDRIPGRGCSVSRITVQLLRETSDMRLLLLEGAMAGHAGRVASDEEPRQIAGLAETTRDYLAIADAIPRRDPPRAARAMEAHVERSGTVLTMALLGGEFQEIEIEQVW
jgi:DNA-binding GntR family transcriptional regulator